jgi:predicted acetyltransferase
VKRILVTCDDDNVGSIKTIEKYGGVLENIVTGPDGDGRRVTTGLRRPSSFVAIS